MTLFAAAQLSRSIDNRGDHKPILSDLRESGSIEQDSDSVIAIYQKDEISPSGIDLLVLKHRNGATGTVTTYFDQQTMRFADGTTREVPFDYTDR